MIRVVCPSCNAKYRLDEARMGGKRSVRAKCQKCGEAIEISADATRPEASAEPPPPSVNQPPGFSGCGRKSTIGR